MPRYVALLGSVNVGRNRVTMAELRRAFEGEGLTNVETVVASGNVLFDHDARPTDGLGEKLAALMLDHFGFTSTAIVRSREELAAASTGNPFVADGDAALVHSMFLTAQPTPDQFDAMVVRYSGRGPERMALGDRALHIDYVDGVGRSALTGAFIERQLQCKGTARNVRSIARIIAKMDEQAGNTA
ncbi:MAG: DUF1697 domain-containing protein [Sphingopyxis sp.]|nr:DUF1697 domain-containing protein [Sphingopyxis sp.]